MRFFLLALVIACFQNDIFVSGNADKILGVFLKVVDKVVPADQVGQIKEKIENMRPCLEHISENVGDQLVEKYTQSILPMSIKCKIGRGDIINNKEEKQKFRACMKAEMEKFTAPLSEKERSAFDETHECMREVDGED